MFASIFHHSASIVAKNFAEITQEQLQAFSMKALEAIFGSEEMKQNSQDLVFEKIAKLSEVNSSKKALLRFLDLKNVAPGLITKYGNLLNDSNIGTSSN